VDRTETDSIRLTVPATSAAVRIARAGAAGLATRAGFTYHEVEQLRLAVGEAVALLAPEPEGDGTLAVTFDIEPDGVRIELHLTDGGSTAGRQRVPGEVPTVAAAVLDAAVDAWVVSDEGRRLVLHKRVSDADSDDD
jgi:anti-sigma regulatory factor (Ser/Thr protein kinase)